MGSDRENMASVSKPPHTLVKKVRSKTFTQKTTEKAGARGPTSSRPAIRP